MKGIASARLLCRLPQPSLGGDARMSKTWDLPTEAPVKYPPRGDSPVQYRSVTWVIVLSLLTLGIYWFYLVYKWSQEIDALTGTQKYSPGLLLFCNILTCGLVGFVLECLFAFDLEKIGAEYGLPDRSTSLGVLVLVFNCVAIFGAAALPVAIALGMAATGLIQHELNKLAGTRALAS
jgi:hypothetical protein